MKYENRKQANEICDEIARLSDLRGRVESDWLTAKLFWSSIKDEPFMTIDLSDDRSNMNDTYKDFLVDMQDAIVKSVQMKIDELNATLETL